MPEPGPDPTASATTPPSKEPRPASPDRPTRFVVLAVLHFVFAGVAGLWTAALIGGLAFASAADSSVAGMMSVSTVAILNGLSVPILISGAIALLRCARWGWYATFSYGLLGMGQSLVLLTTGASFFLATALAIYPLTALILITAPEARRACGVR